jgi:hypothetical protein
LWWCSPFSSLISPWHGVRIAPMFAHASWSSFSEPEMPGMCCREKEVVHAMLCT